MRTLCLVLVVALALPSARTTAQEPPPRGPEPLFPRVFPRPSRLNGYEDLVLACDWIARNPAIDALDQVVDDRSYALSSAVLDADWRPIRKTPAAP